MTLGLVSLGLAGCRETHVRSYTIPSERAERAASMGAPSPGGAAMPASHPPAGGGIVVPHWHLPEGWQEVAGSGMRYATIVVEPGETPLEIRVTPLALAARDPLENVNRWRGQIGLDPIPQSELGTVMQSLTVDGHPAEIVNMTGPSVDGAPAKQILAAMITTDSQVWFFLMLENAKRVAKHAPGFEAFIRGLHMTNDAGAGGADAGSAQSMPPGSMPPGSMPPGSMPPGSMPPGSQPPASATGGETMTWTTPPGWTQDPAAGDMRVASFRLPAGAGEVAITKFPGDVGGLLANINRWRRQIELPPVASPAEQPAESVTVAGAPAQLFDIAQPGSAGTRQRMLVVLVGRPDMTWFVKMTGTAAALDGQVAAFRAFVASVGFQGGAR